MAKVPKNIDYICFLYGTDAKNNKNSTIRQIADIVICNGSTC